MENNKALRILGSIIAWTAIVLAATIPLLFWPRTISTNYPLIWIYLVPKTMLLRLGVIFIQVLLTIYALLYVGTKAYKKKIAIKISWADLSLVAFMILLWFSAQQSLNKNHALFGSRFWLEGFFTYVNYAFIFFAARLFGGAGYLIRLAYVLIVSTIAISLYAIVEAFYPAIQNFTNVGLNGRSGATAGNAVILGAYLILPLVLIGGLFLQKKLKGVWAGLSLTAMGTGLTATVFTFSRGAWIALAAAAVLQIRHAYVAGPRPTRKWLTASAIMLTIVATIIAVGPRAPQKVAARAFSAFNPSEPSSQSRIVAWRQAVRLTTKFPVWGTGIDNFTEAAFTVSPHKEASFLDKPHNFFLEIATTMGIPAFIAYIVFLASIWLGVARMIRLSKPDAAPALTGALAAGAYLAAIFWSFSTINNAPLFYVILGLLAAAVHESDTMPMVWARRSARE